MIVKFGDLKCTCCPLSVHGYSQKATTKGATQSDTIALKPGVNVVTKAQLEELKKNDIFIHRLETGTYQVDEKVAGDSIQGLQANHAIDLVQETLDRNILRKWLVDENRKNVREAIDAQLEKVKPEVAKTPPGQPASAAAR